MTTNNNDTDNSLKKQRKYYKNTVQPNKDDTNLTAQWKKGELENGLYYVLTLVGIERWEYIKQAHGFGYEEDVWILEVLAPVPSYEEWQECELKGYKEGWAECRETITPQIKKRCKEFYTKKYDKKIHKLKELLHRCKYELISRYTDVGEYDYSLINKIDEVLK